MQELYFTYYTIIISKKIVKVLWKIIPINEIIY